MTSSGLISNTPISEDIITKLLVKVYREGRNPFLSNSAPMTLPSVKGIEAGPSRFHNASVVFVKGFYPPTSFGVFPQELPSSWLR
jgi:hypothetical protein